MNSREESIKQKINNAFKPTFFSLENESHMHSGPRTESHFKIVVISAAFANLSRVDRQRLVNDCLKSEFEDGLHALTMRLKTPEEEPKLVSNDFISPNCSSKK